MTTYNRAIWISQNLNINAIFQLEKLKSAIKNETEKNLRLSLNMIDDSNCETNFLHKSLLTDLKIFAKTLQRLC